MLKIVIQVSAMNLKSRLDLTEIFCDVDDFYQSFEQYCRPIPQLTAIALPNGKTRVLIARRITLRVPLKPRRSGNRRTII